MRVMRAVVHDEPESFSVREVDLPSVGPGDVLVRMTATGMCGTDLHLHEGQFLANFPLTPGHETVGVVDTIGQGAVDGTGAAPVIGPQVMINPNSSCRACDYCTETRAWLCESFAGISSSTPGGFAEYVLAPGAQVFDATRIELDLAEFAEPSACIAHLIDRLAPLPGCSVMVLGAAPTGVLLTWFLLFGGASSVVLADSNEFKLAVASSLADIGTFVMNREDVAGSMDALVAASGAFDVVIDATGRAEVVEKLPRLARNGGRIVHYGLADEADLVRMSPFEIFQRELTTMGPFTEVDSFPDALAAFRAGAIRVDGLIAHRFGVDRCACVGGFAVGPFGAQDHDLAVAAERLSGTCSTVEALSVNA